MKTKELMSNTPETEVLWNGKTYQCLKKPNPGNKVGGIWEFKFKGKWFLVRNWDIKAELNKLI